MAIYARPNETVESNLENAPSGLVGVVGVELINVVSEAVVKARTTAGIKELPAGSGTYYASIEAPTAAGTYSIVWDTGSYTPATTAADLLIVNGSGAPPATAGENLITVQQIYKAKGLKESEVETQDRERYEQSIEFASAAVRRYADRTFGKPAVKESRVYEYDSSGYQDIDDAIKIEEVTFIFGLFRTPITEFYWRAEPQEGPPYYYLTVPHWAGIYSPEMGFTYNLDVYSKDRGWPGLIPQIEVVATWGWPSIPLDVQQATILTALDFAEDPSSFVSESIGGYSYAKAIRTSSAEGASSAGPGLVPTALPSRAQDLLAPYVRFQV